MATTRFKKFLWVPSETLFTHTQLKKIIVCQSNMFIVLFQAMGAFFFFVVSWYVISDKSKAERQIACNADIVGGDEERQQTAAYREDVDFREGSQPIIRDRGLDT